MEIDAAPELTPALRTSLERAARSLGVPLADVELLGQDPDEATRFVDAAAQGGAAAYLAALDRETIAGRRRPRLMTPAIVCAVRRRTLRPRAAWA